MQPVNSCKQVAYWKLDLGCPNLFLKVLQILFPSHSFCLSLYIVMVTVHFYPNYFSLSPTLLLVVHNPILDKGILTGRYNLHYRDHMYSTVYNPAETNFQYQSLLFSHTMPYGLFITPLTDRINIGRLYISGVL